MRLFKIVTGLFLGLTVLGGYLYYQYVTFPVAQDTALVQENKIQEHQTPDTQNFGRNSEIATDEGQTMPNLSNSAWQLSDDNSKATLYIDRNTVNKANFSDKAILKIHVKYDYKYEDMIFGPELVCTIFEVWLQPDSHTFRIVKRENFNKLGQRLAIRRYSPKGEWKSYYDDEIWQTTLEKAADMYK
ncbi:MAG: hypothetical protein E6713_17470 [Sporomusaceae bacterium]|nr:hypothetical protein [Sporomusaceae bacterium]